MTFGRKILLGLGLGIATGLLLGDDAAVFGPAADGFVRLLQMSVLPYVTVSLILGIGSLDGATAKRLFLRVGAITLLLWALSLSAVFLMPLVFPALQSASFFSASLLDERRSVDFLSLYIPSNPFYSLANNVVPSVVLFSAILGIALMGVPGRERVIDWLHVVERALARANSMVVRLTPLGLFAIAAHTAGTLDFDQMARLRVYLISYASMALLLALWVFPGLIACLTPIPARRVLQATQDVLITAFMTADLFVVLPSLVERAKLLLEEAGVETEGESPAEVIVPAFYNFPHAAKMLSLSFVLFAAWYSETLLRVADYPVLTAASVVSFFGSMNVSIPFLLDLARVPADTFQLFIATGVINARFGTLAAAMHMVVLAVVGTYAMTGRLRVPRASLLRYAATTVLVTAATVGGLAVMLRVLGGGTYEGGRVAGEMGLLRPATPGAVILKALPAATPAPAQPREAMSILESVRSRGRILVGFIPDQMPYSHVNARGELVGFDVEMAYALARELGVTVEFIPVDRDGLEAPIEDGRVDLVMSGLLLTTRRASRMEFSAPYLDETLAFVVPDHRRAEFSDAAWIRAQAGLRVGIPDLPDLQQLMEREFENVRFVPLELAKGASYLEGPNAFDALGLTAERGSFLTLLHPAYSVAVPNPVAIRLPLAYPVARHDVEMARFLSLWIDLKRKDGTIQALYDHWILGKDARARQPRWSILRDVMGWKR